jgi:hypothetical protein
MSEQPTEHAWKPQEPEWGTARQTPGLAVWALALGLFALLPVLPWLFAIAALICGYGAKRKIDESGGELDGRSMAVAGIFFACAALVIWTVLVVVIYTT